MLKLSKLLHSKGFHITFVNTEFNHKCLLKSRGPHSLDGLPDFRFETIPDGLPPSDPDATQDIPSLCDSTTKACLPHFRELLYKLNDPVSSNGPPVTCIVSDGLMSFTLKAAEEFGVPEVLFWTPSAYGFLGYTKYKDLVEKGLVPLKEATLKASAIIINTFDAFEKPVLDSLSSFLPLIYTLGPLQLMVNQVSDERLKSMQSNLWKEESQCIDWLDTKKPNSVLYVNFGSITVMTPKQLEEFAWGLANSGNDFLWIIRPDLVVGASAMLPPEFVKETEGRGVLASWCPQEQILKQVAIAGFLTHSGWNSTLDSVCSGVPMICWPFFAEQQTNCWFRCGEWGIGMEIDNNVRREEVERQVRELMEGEKGKEMKRKAVEWKDKAEEAARRGGSS
ncbi:hypothetical protein Vadar_022195 [Vaccinium darrowii]|uniref:Uncharacterized protein n=1 Tax=Vaccinium darrowii TaxID=229202 RepID=A0ACB7X2R5_9ERIC|nr:hypothetical protein Vadar_022195 [Vaccinium darrowii]